jgi:hypothetical protein
VSYLTEEQRALHGLHSDAGPANDNADIPPPWHAEIPPHGDDDLPPGCDPTDGRRRAGFPPMLSLTDFMGTFTCPDYLVDGIIQRGRLFGLTSPTGHGKTAVALYLACMIASGQNIGNIEISQGSVLFLAGENPDDLAARVHAACQFYDINPNTTPITVMPGNFPVTPEDAEQLRQRIDSADHKFAAIFIDSAAAYFPGDDENHNVQMGAYARNLRVLTGCRGNPAVVTLCHPVKNADRDNLLPRGGGAFLAELDANLTLWAPVKGETATLHWLGKIRGVDFQPVTFAMHQVTLEHQKDKKGRPFVSIVADLQTAEQGDKAVNQAVSDENTVLMILDLHPGLSVRAMATTIGWVNDKDTPNAAKVHRILKSLQADKLAKPWRGKWLITDSGKAELKRQKP